MVPATGKSRFRVVCLNGTCLDAVPRLHGELAKRPVELVADDSFRTMPLDKLDAAIDGADALILPAGARTFPHAVHMARHPSIRALSIAASGYDWLDVAAATRAGIVVTNVAGGIGAEVVADMAWALMLAVARQVPHHDRVVQAGGSERAMGVSLWRKTLGVIGAGQIGRAVLRRAKGFEMKLLAATPRPDEAFFAAHDVEAVPLEALMRRSDFVSLHVRLTESNRGMIGERELAWMKPTAIFINTARRELIDEAAVAHAVLNKRIAGAGLDDPPSRRDDPLLGLPNVVFTPHLGNRAMEGVEGVFLEAVDNAVAVLEGRRPNSVVNPEVYERGLTGSGDGV